MATKPLESLGWATNQIDEAVDVGGSNQLVTNKVEPTQEMKDSGVLAREKWARSYMNWLFNFIMRWIDNLDTRTAYVGKVEITTNASRTISDYASEFGGTWVKRADDSIGGQTVYVFERTA